MVVSKRCKICTVLDTDNIPISGEYFGKLLPELIAKISGVEVSQLSIYFGSYKIVLFSLFRL